MSDKPVGAESQHNESEEIVVVVTADSVSSDTPPISYTSPARKEGKVLPFKDKKR